MIGVNDSILFGLDECELHECQGVRMHRDVVEYWRQAQNDASDAGFELQAASCYRGFERQLRIWNEKASGRRKVLDENEAEVDVMSMSATDRLWAILRWTALPGISRHHWGTDIDVFDSSSLPEGYQLQLTQAEASSQGVLGSFHRWLTLYISEQSAFFRPYGGGGLVSYEPWHLSCAPVSHRFESEINKERLVQFLSSRQDLLLKDQVLQNIDEIYEGLVLYRPAT